MPKKLSFNNRGPQARLLNSFLFHALKSKLTHFTFEKSKLHYLCHRYNLGYLNERTVEVPVVRNIIAKTKSDKVLELGNVLSHYGPCSHDILDKYEHAPGVINEDVLDFAPEKKYDCIISISTIEHIGWDENPSDTERIYVNGENPQDVLSSISPGKILTTIKHLKFLLGPNGFIVLTVPLGYNPHLDRMIQNQDIAFMKANCFKRISKANLWMEDDYFRVKDLYYNQVYPWANAILVGKMGKD
jgi:hypothetical protein